MRNAKAFTLVELVVALSLVGVVALSFAYLYVASQRFLVQSLNASNAQGEASFVVEHIKRNMLPATAITSGVLRTGVPVAAIERSMSMCAASCSAPPRATTEV